MGGVGGEKPLPPLSIDTPRKFSYTENHDMATRVPTPQRPSLLRIVTIISLVVGCGIFGVIGCAGKKLPPLIFPQSLYPADSYPIHASTGGVIVGIVPYAPGRGMNIDPRQPTAPPEEVPFNMLQAGVFPFRIIMTNRRDGEVVADPSQFFCLSNETPYKSYRPQQAVNLVVGSDVFKTALKGTSIGPLLKSIFGGELIFNAATSSVGGVVRGGVTGGAGGAASSATGTVMARANQYETALTKLLNDQADMGAFKSQTLMPGYTTDGVIYCPSTIAISGIRLTLYDRTNEEPINILDLLPTPTEPVIIPAAK